MADTEQYVEKFRLINEPTNHWEARKSFILRNWGDYPEMQLISLSMVWANMTFDGCKYSPDLMDRVRDMAAGISSSDTRTSSVACQQKEHGKGGASKKRQQEFTEHGSQSSSKRQCTAVGTNQGSSHGNMEGLSTARLSAKDFTGQTVFLEETSPLIPIYPHCQRDGDFSKLSKSCSTFKKKCTGQQISDDHLRQILLNELNSPDTSYTFDYKETNDADRKWQAQLIIFNVLCGVCSNANKKAAKQDVLNALAQSWRDHDNVVVQEVVTSNAADRAFTGKMWYSPSSTSQSQYDSSGCMTTTRSDSDIPNPEFGMSAESILEQQPPDIRTHELNITIAAAPRIPGFFLYETMDDGGKNALENPVCKITNSAGVSKLKCNVEFITEEFPRHKKPSAVLCTVSVSSRRVGTGLALHTKQAKHLAAHNALLALEMSHVTLRRTAGGDGEAVGRNQLTGDSHKETSISESNVGHKMLKMMGWRGEGGLGKSEEGIAVPVKASGIDSSSKTGLGFDLAQLKDPNTKQLDKQRTWQFLQDYASSHNDEDLVLSSEFSIDDRKLVHNMAQKLGLKTKSRGKGESRYLTIGRKWDVHKLVQALAAKGGKIGNYELIQPSLGGSYVPV